MQGPCSFEEDLHLHQPIHDEILEVFDAIFGNDFILNRNPRFVNAIALTRDEGMPLREIPALAENAISAGRRKPD